MARLDFCAAKVSRWQCIGNDSAFGYSSRVEYLTGRNYQYLILVFNAVQWRQCVAAKICANENILLIGVTVFSALLFAGTGLSRSPA